MTRNVDAAAQPWNVFSLFSHFTYSGCPLKDFLFYFSFFFYYLLWCSLNADYSFSHSLACLPLEFSLNCSSFPPTPLTNLITITSSQSSSLLSDVKATGQTPCWEGCSSSPHETIQWVCACFWCVWVCLRVSVWTQTGAGVCTSCLSWPVAAHNDQVAAPTHI